MNRACRLFYEKLVYQCNTELACFIPVLIEELLKLSKLRVVALSKIITDKVVGKINNRDSKENQFVENHE